MRVIIIANGQYKPSYSPKAGDIVLAADGGARHCLTHGIQPTAVIGDMDSLKSEELADLEASGARVISYPTRKDHTDLELALEYALELQPSEILILAGLGGRWDQTIANILLAAATPSVAIRIIHDTGELHFLRAGERLEILGDHGDIVSLIPLSADVGGIHTQGLEYPLNDEPLLFGSTRGVSNVLIGERATITLTTGLLLCTVDHLKEQITNDEYEHL